MLSLKSARLRGLVPKFSHLLGVDLSARRALSTGSKGNFSDNDINDDDQAKQKFLDEYWKKSKEDSRKKRDRFVLGSSVVGVISSLILAAYIYSKQTEAFSHVKKNFVIEKPETKPSIGGPWEMVNQDGERITNEDLYGKWIIYYFGFTHCPDICPEEMEKIVQMVNILKTKHKINNLVPIFVSVDPERDNPAAVKDYIQRYSEDFIGLTGTLDECAAMSKTFRIFYSKGDSDKMGNYQVDHSIVSYLFDETGEFSTYFTRSESIKQRVEKSMKYISRQQQMKVNEKIIQMNRKQ